MTFDESWAPGRAAGRPGVLRRGGHPGWRSHLRPLPGLAAMFAVLLCATVACSTGGQAGPPAAPSATSPAGTAVPSSAPASTVPATSGPAGATGTSGPDSSTEATTGPTTGPTTTAFTSTSLPPRTSASAPTAPVPSGTAAIGTFDAATTSWFVSLCTGLGQAELNGGHDTSGSVEEQRASAVAAFDKEAAAYRTMHEDLVAIGPPGIPGGEDLQQTLVATLPGMADAADAASAQVAAAADGPAIATAVQQGAASVQQAAEPLGAFAEAMAAPALTAQVIKIQQCTDLFT